MKTSRAYVYALENSHLISQTVLAVTTRKDWESWLGHGFDQFPILKLLPHILRIKMDKRKKYSPSSEPLGKITKSK